METKTIAKVNNVDIVSTNDERSNLYAKRWELTTRCNGKKLKMMKTSQQLWSLTPQLQPMEKNGKCAVCLSAISLDGYSLSIPQM